MSFIYGIPVHELQQRITSAEFSELAEYIKLNTAAPELWWSSALQTSKIVQALTGEWINPAEHVPGQVDLEKLRSARMEAAERRMDRDAKGS